MCVWHGVTYYSIFVNIEYVLRYLSYKLGSYRWYQIRRLNCIPHAPTPWDNGNVEFVRIYWTLCVVFYILSTLAKTGVPSISVKMEMTERIRVQNTSWGTCFKW